MHIKILFTGGTIGSAVMPDGALDTADSYELLRRYAASHPDDRSEFDARQPLSVLSENLTAADWNQLLDALRRIDWDGCDGVIITHGTDTLAFTANLLAVVLEDVRIPVLMVSSQYVLDDPRSDGLQNFEAAVRYICGGGPAGVYVPTSNGRESVSLYRAAGLRQCDPANDAFTNADGAPFGHILSGRFSPSGRRPEPQKPKGGAPATLTRIGRLTDCVLLIQPYPGLDYRSLTPSDGIRAVLHGAYHSGTASALLPNNPHSLLYFQTVCRHRGLPVFLAPVRSRNALYETMKNLQDDGILPLRVRTLEEAFAELLVALCLHRDVDGALLRLRERGLLHAQTVPAPAVL